MSNPVRVLLVDDDPDFAALTATRLERGDGRFAVETAESATDGMVRLTDDRFDCVVSAYDLPGADGLEFLERLREDDPDLPFVLFAEAGSEDVASRAITLGVTDYVSTGRSNAFDRLADRLEEAVDRDRSRRRSDGREPTATPSSDPSERPQYGHLHDEHDVVLDRMTDVFTALDADWRITYLNEGGRRAIVSNLTEDRSKEELLGEHFWSISDESSASEIAETALYRSCHEAMERQEMVTHEKYYEDGDYWVYTRVYPSETGVSIFSRDITERKKKEEELERRIDQLQEYERQIERLEEFAGIVSHDLRNPLNVAQGHLELARETGDVDHLEAVARSHERMEALVEDLLVLAREGAEIDELDRVDLGELIEKAWRTVETGDASLETDVDRVVSADRSRLAQLFENLFRNSVEHGSTSPDSHARQDAAGASSGEPSVADAPEDAVEHRSTSLPSPSSREDPMEHGGSGVTVRIVPIDGGFAVEDDGRGIPPSARDRVFDAGYTTDREGTGFGLQIVRDVAEAHHWEVAVTEGRNGGARFEFTGVDWTDPETPQANRRRST